MKRRNLLAGLGVVGLAALWQLSSHGVFTHRAALVPGTVEPRVPPPPLNFSWETGDNETVWYQLDYQVQVLGTDSWTLRTRLAVRVLERQGGSVRCALQLIAPKLDPKDPSLVAMFTQAPVRVTFAENGRILDVKLPGSLPADEIFRLANILYPLQIVLDSRAGYEMVETDANGRSEWRYQVDFAANSVRKRRLWLLPDSARPRSVSTQIDESEVQAAAGAFWLEWLTGHEAITVALKPEGEVIAQPVIDWSLHRIPPPRGVKVEWLTPPLWVSASSVARQGSGVEKPEEELQRWRDHYAAITVADCLTELSNAVQAMEDHGETVPAMEALAELLQAYPERAGDLLEVLADPGLSDPVRARAMHALELAGRNIAEAQGALAEILLNIKEYPPEAVSQAIVAAGGVGEVRDEGLLEGLAELATSHPDPYQSDAATLALGRLAEFNPDIRDLVSPGLEDMLLSPESSPEDLTMALWTLRNGRITSPEFRSIVEELRESEHEAIRSAAREYLRLYSGGPGDR